MNTSQFTRVSPPLNTFDVSNSTGETTPVFNLEIDIYFNDVISRIPAKRNPTTRNIRTTLDDETERRCNIIPTYGRKQLCVMASVTQGTGSNSSADFRVLGYRVGSQTTQVVELDATTKQAGEDYLFLCDCLCFDYVELVATKPEVGTTVLIGSNIEATD